MVFVGIVVRPSFSLHVCLVPQFTECTMGLVGTTLFICQRRSSEGLPRNPFQGGLGHTSAKQPNHVSEALEVDVGFVCTEADEVDEHLGDMSASILVPTIAEEGRGTTPFSGVLMLATGAGAVYHGPSPAVNLV